MRISKKLLFNLFTKEALERSSNILFLNRRLKSMLTDLSFMLSLLFPFLVIALVPIFVGIVIIERPTVLLPIAIGLIPFSLFTAILLNKDYFNGKSIGKRLFGYQVVDNKTNKPAYEMQCVLRNVTLIIWPLEVFVALISPNKRLGDLIAGTKLIDIEKEDPELIMDEIRQEKTVKGKTKLIWISVLIAFTFSVLSVLPTLFTFI